MSNSVFLLEILNGGAVTPELFCLVLLAMYLSKEAKRRGMRRRDWFKLPPSMNLILAMFIYDTGVFLRSATIWAWRRFGGRVLEFNVTENLLLILGGSLIVFGSLCKIRALTKPEQGDGIWFAATAATVLAIVLLILFR